MPLETGPNHPSPKELALEALQTEHERIKSHGSQTDDEGDYFLDFTTQEKVRDPQKIEDAIEKNTLIGFLNNFPFNLPNSQGLIQPKWGKAVSIEDSTDKYAIDVRNTIKEVGIDQEELGQYIDKIRKLGTYGGDLKGHKELLLPIYIKLLEKGYDRKLCV